MTLQTMRKFHRWFGAVSAVFMLFIGFTGLFLQIDLWLAGKAPPGRTLGPPPVHPQLATDNLAAVDALECGMDAIRSEFPNAQVGTATVNLKTGAVQFSGSNMDGERFTRVGANCQYIQPKPVPTGLEYVWTRDWHYIMQDLHAGYYFGLFGRIISCLLGISLIVLSITGLNVYLDMHSRRKKQGRKGLFW